MFIVFYTLIEHSETNGEVEIAYKGWAVEVERGIFLVVFP